MFHTSPFKVLLLTVVLEDEFLRAYLVQLLHCPIGHRWTKLIYQFRKTCKLMHIQQWNLIKKRKLLLGKVDLKNIEPTVSIQTFHNSSQVTRL